MSELQQSAAFLKGQKKQQGGLLRYAIALGSLGGLLVIAQAWCLAHIVNAVIFSQQTLHDVQIWLAGILIIILLRVMVSYATERVAFLASAVIKQNIRESLLKKLQQLGPAYLSAERSGEISTTLTNGVEALENYYARYLPAMSLALWIPLSILVFVFPVDWKSGLVMILTAPLIPFFMILIGKGAEKLNQHQWKQLARLGGHFLDVIQGLVTLKLFNASKRESKVVERISEEYRDATMKVLRVAFLSSLALEFFATVSIAIVAVLIGFRLLFVEMGFESGFFILLLAPEFYLPLRALGTHYHGRMEAIASSERIIEILQTPVAGAEDRSIQLNEQSIGICLRNVSFNYAERPALKEVSFEIEAGTHVAIVGPSGSGKTTLVNLLLGFLQVEQGQILINEQNLDRIQLESWRRNIAWIPQRPRMFSASIRSNITLGLNEVSDDLVFQALEQAHAMEFVEKLEQGINTLVGEGGHGLSGGQIQRLALARAFIRNPAVIILDEPTAHLDKRSEELVQKAIHQYAKGRTMISVAHRLSTIEQADQIIVLNEGKVVQQGTHDQLKSQAGLYQQLVLVNGVIS
jgi:ATP-binding cassette, subfamily C, bacterial CydD